MVHLFTCMHGGEWERSVGGHFNGEVLVCATKRVGGMDVPKMMMTGSSSPTIFSFFLGGRDADILDNDASNIFSPPPENDDNSGRGSG